MKTKRPKENTKFRLSIYGYPVEWHPKCTGMMVVSPIYYQLSHYIPRFPRYKWWRTRIVGTTKTTWNEQNVKNYILDATKHNECCGVLPVRHSAKYDITPTNLFQDIYQRESCLNSFPGLHCADQTHSEANEGLLPWYKRNDGITRFRIREFREVQVMSRQINRHALKKEWIVTEQFTYSKVRTPAHTYECNFTLAKFVFLDTVLQ